MNQWLWCSDVFVEQMKVTFHGRNLLTCRLNEKQSQKAHYADSSLTNIELALSRIYIYIQSLWDIGQFHDN